MNKPFIPSNLADEKILTEIEQRRIETYSIHGIWALSIMFFGKAPDLLVDEQQKIKKLGHCLMEGINDYEMTIGLFSQEYNEKIQALNTYLIHAINDTQTAEIFSKILMFHLHNLPMDPTIEEGVSTYRAIIDDCLKTFSPLASKKESIIIDTQDGIIDNLKRIA